MQGRKRQMGFILILVGGLLSLASAVCSIIVLIAAFRNEIWKGIVGLLCGLYLLYFMFAEFQHEKKNLIIAGSLVGGILGSILFTIGMGMIALTAG